MKDLAFFMSAMLILSTPTSVHAVEELMPHAGGIGDRITQKDALLRPFQVIVDRSGQLTIQPQSIFTEGTENLGFELPQLVTNPEPVALPQTILDQQWQGEIVIAVAVKTDGSVGETMVMQSSNNSSLDEWATQLVKGWQFHPAMKDGQPIYECIQIPILFKWGLSRS